MCCVGRMRNSVRILDAVPDAYQPCDWHRMALESTTLQNLMLRLTIAMDVRLSGEPMIGQTRGNRPTLPLWDRHTMFCRDCYWVSYHQPVCSGC